MHFVYFDTGSIPVVIGLSNLPASPKSNKPPARPGPDSGYVVYCEGGRFEGQRGRGVGSHGVELDSGQIKLSPVLDIDVERERFVGPHAQAANALLKREYRAPYLVPEIA